MDNQTMTTTDQIRHAWATRSPYKSNEDAIERISNAFNIDEEVVKDIVENPEKKFAP